jgi:hypothetical protein
MHDIIKELIVNNEIFCFSDLSKKSILQENLNISQNKINVKQLYLILEAFPAVTVPPFSKLGRSFFSFTGSN